MAGYLRGSAGRAGLGGLALCLSGGDVPEGGKKPLTIGVSFEAGEQVAQGGIAWHIVTPYRRIGTLLGRKQNAPEMNIPVNDSGAPAFKGPTQQQPSWRTDVRGIRRAIASYARTG
jgi:hypothetical protein